MKESEIWGGKASRKGHCRSNGRQRQRRNRAMGEQKSRERKSATRQRRKCEQNNESDTTAPRPRDTTAGLGAESGRKAQTCERRAARGSNLEKELKGQPGKAGWRAKGCPKRRGNHTQTHAHIKSTRLQGAWYSEVVQNVESRPASASYTFCQKSNTF